jgi:hypothetical protein
MEEAKKWVNDHKEFHDAITEAVHEVAHEGIDDITVLLQEAHEGIQAQWETVLAEIEWLHETVDEMRKEPPKVVVQAAPAKDVGMKVEPAAIPLDKEMVKQVALDILKAIPPEELRKQINEGIALAVDKLRGKVR